MPREIEKVYAPKTVEDRWSKAWVEEGLFRSEPRDRTKVRPYVIVIPPPNITGALHMGHALNNTLQDALVRWQRMKGHGALWVPGTDHGGIATQNVVEKLLKAEGTSRDKLGRDAFLERMRSWRDQTGDTILNQLKRLGCSLDWSRKRFTMDEVCSKAVVEAFRRLWEKGLIYRGERMINWCVRCGTALSDIEVEMEERKGKLWHIRYPGTDGGPGVVVATTRPETMLGDTAVAVHPKSEKWAGMIGKKVRLPLTGRDIPVVGDESVDLSFGQGALKVTPAHDPVDFELGQKHGLPLKKVIGPDGKMTADAGKNYAGLARDKAREKVLEDLEAEELLEKIDDYPHSVPTCYRCQQVIEPLLSEQWFVRMKELAAPALEAAEKGSVRFHPKSWKSPFTDWLANIKDWCISRQIWWGHRIPVWYCYNCNDQAMQRGSDFLMYKGRVVVQGVHQSEFIDNLGPARPLPGFVGFFAAEPPSQCPKCGGGKHLLLQDPDVLDTWFSSGLWPFSVFGWPEPSKDLEYFYPTSVLVTGYEIIYLWVSRMVMMGLEFMKQVPFTDVYIHGIVRDKHGKKMSKSLGNVVDPLGLMEKYGTDALRFSLVSQAVPGRDIQFGEEALVGPRNFANKLWNSTRFVLMNLPETAEALSFRSEDLELADRWILHELSLASESAMKDVDGYDLASAAQGLYAFVWDKFCDWYIELAKDRLQGADEKAKRTTQAVLVHVLSRVLRLLHPFMPFITEELWQAVRPYAGETEERLLRLRLPAPEESPRSPKDAADMAVLMSATTSIRTVRSQFNVPPAARITSILAASDPAVRGALSRHARYIEHLARLEKLELPAEAKRPPHSATAVVPSVGPVYIPLEGLIDLEKEKVRLAKERDALGHEIERLAQKLSNPAFVERAPKEEVERQQNLLAEREERRRHLQDSLASLQ